MSKISIESGCGKAKTISGHELWLLYLPKSQIDRELSGTPSQHIKGLQNILDSLMAQPQISSKIPGLWSSLGVRKLSAEQAEQEVGFLYKNTTPVQRQALRTLNSQHIFNSMWKDQRYLEHVCKERQRLGLDRTCRMKANYQPKNELCIT